MKHSLCKTTKIKLKQNSACWQISPNGQHLIGHMLLRKNNDDEDVLGLKITSDSTTNNGAIIEKVKIGSIAEQVHLKPGKTQNLFYLFE